MTYRRKSLATEAEVMRQLRNLRLAHALTCQAYSDLLAAARASVAAAETGAPDPLLPLRDELSCHTFHRGTVWNCTADGVARVRAGAGAGPRSDREVCSMSNPTINNTPRVRPVPYVRSSRPSLDRLQSRIAPVAGVTAAAAASTWVVSDRAPGGLAALAAGVATIGTLAIAAGPVVSILHDARDGHAPRDEDLAPVIAAAAAAYATAVWSGLWIQLVVLVLGSIVITAQMADLVHEARVQLGQGVEW